MPLQLEIVTPERLAYSDEVDAVVLPGSEGELGVLPHHAPLVSTLGVGELRLRKGGQEESFAIVGGFLQVLPDKVVVMAETADMASEIDLEKAQEARREAEQALESRLRRGRRPGRGPRRAPDGAAPDPGRGAPPPRGPADASSAGCARDRGTGDRTAWLTPDRSTGSTRPTPVTREVFRIEGGVPLARRGPDQRRRRTPP